MIITMDDAAPRALYERFIAAVDSGDAALLDVLAEDVVDHDAMPGQAPGREGFAQWLAVVRAAFPDLAATVDDLLVDGDRVAARVTYRGRHDGPFLGIPGTGRSVEFSAHHLARVAGGEIIEFWGVPDLLDALTQIGASVSGP